MSEQRLIDAFEVQRLLNMSYNNCGLDGFSLGFRKALGLAIQTIENAQTIDNVRHGEWLNHNGYDDWYCSKCGFEINYDGNYPAEYDNFKFCGKCGVKMYGGIHVGRFLDGDYFLEEKQMTPLTLEELMQRNGKPVYIVEEGEEPGWELADDAMEYFLEREAIEYGQSWFAYDREPEEVRRE